MKVAIGEYYPKNGEVHFNPNGHFFAAEQISEYLNESGILDPNPTKEGKGND